MRILWFTNTACSAASKLGLPQHSGSWLVSLEQELSNVPGLELSISFYHHVPLSPFKEGKVQYLPVFRARARTKPGRALQRAFHNQVNKDKQELRQLRD